MGMGSFLELTKFSPLIGQSESRDQILGSDWLTGLPPSGDGANRDHM